MEDTENSSLESPSEREDADPPMLGREGVVDKTQFIRLILQSLYSLGYRKAASTLEFESGVQLDSPEYTSLLFDIISGRWDDCIATIDAIDDLETESRSLAAFLVWKEHFLELLGSSDGLLPARDVLWNRIAPLDLDQRRIHKLARALISSEGMVTMENRVRKRIGLLLDLVDVLPSWIRVPSGRLEHLVETAVLRQMNSCFYHNSPEDITLYEDHECSQDQVPSRCSQTLRDHKNEVWFVQFSNSGEYLASSSSDRTAIIWRLIEYHSATLATVHMYFMKVNFSCKCDHTEKERG